MEATGLAQYAAGIGLQGFFVLFVWRMARRLYPLIDRIKEMDTGPVAVESGTGDPQSS